MLVSTVWVQEYLGIKCWDTLRLALKKHGISYVKQNYLNLEDIERIPKRRRVYAEDYDSFFETVPTKEFLILANLTLAQLSVEIYKGTLEPVSWRLDANGHKADKHWYKLDATFFNDKAGSFESKTSDPIRLSTMDVWYDVFEKCPSETVNGLEKYKILGKIRDGLKIGLKEWRTAFGTEQGYKSVWDLEIEKLPKELQI